MKKIMAVFFALCASVSWAAQAEKYQTNVVPASNQVRRSSLTFGADPATASRRVAFVGNSITRHGPKPSIGWTNDCGMAASSLDRDYVHQCAALLEKTVPGGAYALVNVAGTLERTFMNADWTPESHFAALKDFRPDVVVFFFGANVPRTYDAKPQDAARTFGDAVEALARYVDTGKTRFLVSEGFYIRPALDEEKRSAAKRLGAEFVTMDDIRRRDDTHGRFNHPGDFGMKLIAERFAAAIDSGAAGTAASAEVVSWQGEGLSAWIARKPSHCDRVRLEDGVIKGLVTGRDSQFYARVDFAPAGNQVFNLRLKCARGGSGQLFWTSDEVPHASEAATRRFFVIGDGAWHDYKIRPGWSGTRLKTIRLDLPPECAGGTAFEIASASVTAEGVMLDVDTKSKIGVAFDLALPKGVHYCTLVWTTDKGPGEFGFMPATDGRNHSYWFDLRGSQLKGWGARRGTKCWVGKISYFGVHQVRQDRELPVKNLRFIDRCPETAADPVVTSARPAEAIPRAGRPFPVEVIVRNFGTCPARNVAFAFDSLPAGVTVADPRALTPSEPLPGADGTETIWADCRKPLVQERVYRLTLTDLGVGVHRFGLTLKADGIAPQRVEVEAEVKPSLGLARVDYPAEPQPVSTEPYEIGAFLFPGWTNHRWHGVWSHAPWRKPLLGWYDEENPETIDWQIKQMVENGISYVFVDWYWSRGHQHLNHWMNAFKRAKYRKYLKWSVMWANHNGHGSHSVADQEKVTRFWVENFFGDPEYQTLDGMPVVTIWSPSGMEEDMKGKGGCKALLEVSQRVAREAGYKGIYFIAVRGPDTEDAGFLKTFADQGFRRTCVYKYVGGIPGVPTEQDGSRPFKWIADTSLAHWRALKANSTVPFLPSLSTAWDDRPWRGESGWAVTGINAADYRRICADAKTYSDQTGDRMLLMGPLDEWGEGSIGYPNAELGFGMFEAVRDTFGRRPATGWPVNHAPEDVGLVCPQRNLTE